MDVLSEEKEFSQIGYYRAQWDTGAINTVITQRVVDELGLMPIDYIDNYTAAGMVKSAVYRINVVLPNKVRVTAIKVACCDLADIDMLIGMDVITMCDFAITNVGEKTTFSFQIPSATTIDFEKQ